MASSSNRDAEALAELRREIYRVVRRIPRGAVATYGQVAELAGIPRGGRIAGVALRHSTPEMGLPWHRVVGKRARGRAAISLRDPVGGAMQRTLLEKEGIELSDAGTISLVRFGWLPLDPPADAGAAGRRRRKRARRPERAPRSRR